jgi:hypothetical protein
LQSPQRSGSPRGVIAYWGRHVGAPRYSQPRPPSCRSKRHEGDALRFPRKFWGFST